MTPLSDLVAAILERVIAHRQRAAAEDQAPWCHPNTCPHECLGLGYCVEFANASTPHDPRDRDSIDAWAEPEIETPLFVGDRP